MIEQIYFICRRQYGRVDAKLAKLFSDVTALYAGEWPEFEACQVGYHNLHHSVAVALATARMTYGWNKVNSDRTIAKSVFLAGIAASLLHDSGYLKEKNDTQGKGGKYTFSHVGRSRDLAYNYLSRNRWSKKDITFICRMIDATEFGQQPDMTVFKNEQQLAMAQMVATADLIAQMADINYVRRLHDLHDEFLEAYDTEGRKNLRQRAVHVYDSFQEMLNTTPEFYENFILPRLKLFNRMDNYLVAFFADGRNPYFESITANISGQLLSNRVQWQRLGDILQELSLVDPEVLSEALTRQRQGKAAQPLEAEKPAEQDAGEQLLDWLQSRTQVRTRLGGILMEMNAVDPRALRTGLLSQLLPQQLTRKLTQDELLTLLQIALLAQNLYDDPWVFAQIIEMAVELLDSQSGSLMLANRRKNEMLIAIHCGPHKEQLEGRSIPIDKGLSGWVYRHAKAAFVIKSSIGDLAWENSYPGGEEIHNILAVPLHINGEIIGVAEVINKQQGPFNDHDADILTLLANVMTCSLSLVKKLQLNKKS
ncbi:MAG: GAF domain-containing protein [Thermodesulfobacteriota bacterium]